MMNMNNLGENLLNDDALENVTGGKREPNGNNNGNNPVTKMVCKYCGYELDWVGQFEGKTFECRRCHRQNALEGIKTTK